MQLLRTEGLIQQAFRQLEVPDQVPDPAKIEKVVVILGSSRSGSSLLFHRLAQSGAFFCPQGEETPFYRLGGVGPAFTLDDDDRLKALPSEEELRRIRRALWRDLGRGPAPVDTRYLAQSIARILLQWPDRNWDIDEMILTAQHTLDGDAQSWPRFLSGMGVDAALYDGLTRPTTTTFDPRTLLEEPPFITQLPRQAPYNLNAPLLLKTPSNVYRPELLRALFPKADFKWILLTRNPAASINGLMDGWRSQGFHSHRTEGIIELKIAGYSELRPENAHWWKFDLPPGWGAYVTRELSEVCAFQWTTAYRAALDIPGQKLRVRCEDIQSGADLDPIFKYCGVQPVAASSNAVIPPVMASRPPAPGRWRARRSEIEPRLRDADVQLIARELGYNLDSPQELV